MTPYPREDITAVVLAGGRARRMGGEDKGLIEVAGKPMVAHTLDVLRPQAAEVVVNANRNAEAYRAITGCRVIADTVGGFAGPLAGMASALQASATRLLLTAPCDSPLVTGNLGPRLHEAMARDDAEIAVAHDGERMQPVFALLAHGLLPDLLAFLRSGERKIDTWYATRHAVTVDLSDTPDSFLNVNTPRERDHIEQRLARRRMEPERAGRSGQRLARRAAERGRVPVSVLTNAHIPILGFAAWSGTGKTTLLRRLLPILAGRGLRVGMVKHAHHDFDVDTPGKDSYELRKAGAAQMLISSRRRWALMVERPADREPPLDEVLLELDQELLDLILVEGFKHERFPKIELHRPSFGRPLLHPGDDTIVAIATDAPLAVPVSLPMLDLNSPDEIAGYVVESMMGGADTHGLE